MSGAWARLGPLLYGHRLTLLTVALGATTVGFTEAAILALVIEVAAGLAGGDISAVALGPLQFETLDTTTALLIAAGLSVVRLGLQVLIAYLPAKVTTSVQADLRSNLSRGFHAAQWATQSRVADGELLDVMSSQTNRASQAVIQLAAVLGSGGAFSALVVAALLLSPIAAGTIVVASVLLFLLLRPLSKVGNGLARALSRDQVRLAGHVSEAVRMAVELNVYGVGSVSDARVDAQIQTVRRRQLRSLFISRLVPGLYQATTIGVVVAGLAIINLSGIATISSLGAVVLVLIRAMSYGQILQGSYHTLREVSPFIDRVRNTIANLESDTRAAGTTELDRVDSIQMHRVAFAYERSTVQTLHDLDLTIDRGETVGIVGPSGVGKSTLVQLLLRIRDPQSGSYLVNDLPVADYVPADWAQRFAFVAQDPQLIRGTVAANIRFFRENISDAAVELSARRAAIHEEIMQLKDGYETRIDNRGDTLSGGQKQRIALARALAGDPDVLILDEPTSALDNASELSIQRSLAQLKGSMTQIIVAHRDATLQDCDRLIELRVSQRVGETSSSH